MPTLDEIKHRTTPVGKVHGVIEYLAEQEQGGGGNTIPPGSLQTDMYADKSVTDEKLATPKVDKPDALTSKVVLGTSLERSELGLVGYSQEPMGDQLVMYQFGGQVATAEPQADGDAANKKYVDDQIAVLEARIAALESGG